MVRKSLNEIFPYEPIRILVGVPINVLIPITLDAMTSGINKASGLIPMAIAICTLMGVIKSIVVTLSRKRLMIVTVVEI